ncbi:Dehydrogenase, partial [Rhizoctonia solani]
MNSLDHKILTYGILAQEWPWVGGNEYAGTVVSIGPAVENLAVGDRVVAVAVNFIEGQEVSGWQEYALLRADLCTKLPGHVSFDKACTVPTAFAGASIAIAIELGLKYPDPPPPPPTKSAASIWESAMAALGNGATFGWDLEAGTIRDGVWLPKPKVSAIEGATLSPEAAAKKAEAERLRREEEERQAKAREERDAYVHATLTRAFTEEVEKRRNQGPQHSAFHVPGYGTRPHRKQGSTIGSDSWGSSHPVSWGAFDVTHEAKDRRWGSSWEDRGALRRFEVIDEGRNALGLVTTGLGLDFGPRFGSARLTPQGSAGTDSASTTSASTSMGRTGSDDSNTSVSTSETTGMCSSYPCLPAPNVGLVGRRGSEPSLRAQQSLSTWMGVKSAPDPGLGPTYDRYPLLPAHPSEVATIRPRSSGSVPSKPTRSLASSVRGATSPFRVPATLANRGRGRGSPPYRIRDQSPLGQRVNCSLDVGMKLDLAPADRLDSSIQYSAHGVTTHIAPSRTTPSIVTTAPKPDAWSLSAGGGVPNTFFPPPLPRTGTPVYVMDEPILLWGGATCAGRAALQLLGRAGYTNLFVVAARERHSELTEICPAGTKFFDYRDLNVVDEIRSSIGVRKLNKVIDTVSMPCTLEPISRLVTSGAKIATFLPVNTPMPDGVEVKPVMFGRCHDYTGKDTLSFNFGKESMWPLLGELLRKEEWVYPPAVHLDGGLRACATDAMRMMSLPEYAGKRLVFEVSSH